MPATFWVPDAPTQKNARNLLRSDVDEEVFGQRTRREQPCEHQSAGLHRQQNRWLALLQHARSESLRC